MSDLARGDIVSLSRAQVQTVDVASLPAGADEPYTINLPINPNDIRSFTFLGNPGDTAADLIAGLEAVLLEEQTVFSPAVAGSQLVIVGPLGLTFTATVSANLSTAMTVEAVSAINQQTGEQIGNLRVVHAENTLERLRAYATRDPNGVVRSVEQILLRELGTSNQYDVERTKILTIIEKEGTTPP